MPLYTSRYLKNLSERKTVLFSRQVLNESKKIHTSFDIFLSHSFLDKNEVEGLYIELTNQGYSVYVDWIIDPHLDRTNVTKSSAKLIQNRLKISKTLLLAISTNATVSKWMPWELGYVDGNTNKCAIIPISKSEYAPDSYVGLEYLSIYPFIKKVPTKGSGEKLFVIEEALKYIIFDNWLKLGEKPKLQTINIF
ncbi:TIR domain-containing protein [Nonlabens xylanidelens]|uniref:TIR domain-containing protein n=1 Tax=Nonlabens xylanidelens TaxID=191564 RepID=A0A2S6INV1_9FLAO|nr:toll/interleukin-1 receptor domain-containing protein [Nonlabens xylanidelens]PPK95810.1 TIR domain-containing protein [Nonlabens xylanidelens]